MCYQTNYLNIMSISSEHRQVQQKKYAAKQGKNTAHMISD